MVPVEFCTGTEMHKAGGGFASLSLRKTNTCRRDHAHPWQSHRERFCAFISQTSGQSSIGDLPASMVWSQQMQFGIRIPQINHHQTPSGFQLRVTARGKKNPSITQDL